MRAGRPCPPVTSVVHTFLWDYFKSLFPDDPTSSCNQPAGVKPANTSGSSLMLPTPFSAASCVHSFPAPLQMPILVCENFHGFPLGCSSCVPAHRLSVDCVPFVLVPSPHPAFCAITTLLHRTLVTPANPTVKEGSMSRTQTGLGTVVYSHAAILVVYGL